MNGELVIVAPNGQPARPVPPNQCPRCGAGRDKRTLSAGFGEPHDVCVCGYEFLEVTR